MDSGTIKTPIEMIKEGAFGGFSSVNGKWYRKSWKEFNDLKSLNSRYHCLNYYDISVNKYGVKCRTPVRFWANKGWIKSIDPYGWFLWYFRY